jgi:site-specific DNA recombinase
LLPLTYLAPNIVEGILDGRRPKGLRVAEVLGNGPLDWKAQRERFGFSN